MWNRRTSGNARTRGFPSNGLVMTVFDLTRRWVICPGFRVVRALASLSD
jgi:hypothetical protein